MYSCFDAQVAFEPGGEPEAFLRSVPAKWVVYVLADGDGRPVQLLTVKNLRAALKRRLIEGVEDDLPSKRVDYRDLVRRVHWCRVDSRFEADAAYLTLAREVFPETYAELMRLEPAQFLHVDVAAAFPRFVRTTDLSLRSGVYLGPLEDKGAAGRLVEQIESAFDLCRYYNILVQAPRGKPCAYKEMGKCPAPCDGTISMDAYRQLLALAVQTLADPADAARQQDARMRQAAAALEFELAGRIKQYAGELAELTKGANRHVRPLADFRFLSLQPGPRKGTGKIFLVTPSRCEHVGSLVGEPTASGEVFRLIHDAMERNREGNEADAGFISLVTAHLFAPAKGASGVLVPLSELDDRVMDRAWKELGRQDLPAEPEVSEAGASLP